MNNKEKTACFTGHRNIQDTNIKNKLQKEIENLIKKGVIYFGNGGALGFDTLAAMTVLELREKYPQIKLIMVLPCHEQDKLWSAEDKQVYTYILKNSDKKIYTSEHYHQSCMFVRNRHLVDNSSYCIAYFNKNRSGTAYTVDYAMKNGVKIINIAGNG